MATLEKRIAALEAAAASTAQGDGYGFAPLMTVDEWTALAPAQQAALVKETLELATRGASWQH